MKNTELKYSAKKAKTLIKRCHCCGHIMEGIIEFQKCDECKKSFLPSNYFNKVHAKNSMSFANLFSSSDELHEEELIKGLHILW